MRRKSVAFDFCERLRNFAQHQFQPVSFTTAGGAWDDNRRFREHQASLYAAVEDVCRARDIGENERQSYRQAFGETADISLIFRETIGCIGQFVRQLRLKLDADVHRAVTCYEGYLQKISMHSEEYEIGTIVLRSEEGDQSEFDIFRDFLNWVRKLNMTFYSQNNERQFISNRAFGHR